MPAPFSLPHRIPGIVPGRREGHTRTGRTGSAARDEVGGGVGEKTNQEGSDKSTIETSAASKNFPHAIAPESGWESTLGK